MQKYAVIENNKVINIALASQDVASERGWILVSDDAAIGWDYIDGKFIDNRPQSDYTEINRQQAMSILQETDWVELHSVSDSTNDVYLSNVNDFLSYRSVIRSIAVNPPNQQIEFPQKPQEIWS